MWRGCWGQKIKIGEEILRVYVAYDRRYKDNDGQRAGNERREIRSNCAKNGYSFRDVGNGSGPQASNKDEINMNKEDKWSERTIEGEDLDVNKIMLGRSVVGEVKALCFLSKLLTLCEEQGLGKIEVKLLGGLEVIVVLENC
ncbi:hypothetical protein Tco_1424230 [Tanacetum coccineum]